MGQRIMRSLASVALFAGAIAPVAPISSAGAAGPTIAVTPATDLVPGQSVTVTGSGFAGTNLLLMECPAGVAGVFDCDFGTLAGVFPDASGAFETSYAVRRTIRVSAGRIDCSAAPDTCELIVADGNAIGLLARHPLTFDPTAPSPQSSITVTPATGLLAGQGVTVTGAGFAANDFVEVQECATVDPDCSASIGFVQTDPNGAFTTQITVRLRVGDASGVTTNCLVVDCVVRAVSQQDLEYSAEARITFDPTQPIPDPPAITVTPSTGLLHDQVVTVTGTGFDTDTFVQLSECPAGTDPYCDEYLGGTSVGSSGSFTTTVPVSRLTSTYDAGGESIVDCAVVGCSITALGFPLDGFGPIVARAAIAFDGSVAPPDPPVVTVTPTTDLPYRAQVTVHGTGFSPGGFVYAEFCAGSPQSGGCGFSDAQSFADGNGTVDFTLNIKRRVSFGGDDVVDCIDAATQCSVRIQGMRSYERAEVPITFDPAAPIPPPPVVTVTPDQNLGYRQSVSLTGSGFTPGGVVVQQCGRVSSGPGSFDVCEGFTELQADAAGTITGTAPVRRVLAFGTNVAVDCATSPVPCKLQIGFGDPDESATVPLGFDPNSQPPPPPAVTLLPATHIRDGQPVSIRGSRFAANTLVGLAPCKGGVTAIADDCDIGRLTVASTDDTGAFTTTISAAAVIQTSQGPVDCTMAAGACVLAAANAADLSEFAFASMSFDVPELEVHSVTVTEGTVGTTPAPVMVELSEPSLTPLTVDWRAVPGTAGPDDYAAARGRFTIPAGTTESMLHVPVVGDALDENTERFTVEITAAHGARITDGTATVKIKDDDPEPVAGIGNATVSEGAGFVDVPVIIAAKSGRTVTIEYRTHHDSARSGRDFERSKGDVIFGPGEQLVFIRIPILDDRDREKTESFTVELDDAEHARIVRDEARITITDDD